MDMNSSRAVGLGTPYNMNTFYRFVHLKPICHEQLLELKVNTLAALFLGKASVVHIVLDTGWAGELIEYCRGRKLFACAKTLSPDSPIPSYRSNSPCNHRHFVNWCKLHKFNRHIMKLGENAHNGDSYSFLASRL
jgi:hypothetical protein